MKEFAFFILTSITIYLLFETKSTECENEPDDGDDTTQSTIKTQTTISDDNDDDDDSIITTINNDTSTEPTIIINNDSIDSIDSEPTIIEPDWIEIYQEIGARAQ